ncbi:MAG: ABC transporter permease subunit [Planctomycetota bacterium]
MMLRVRALLAIPAQLVANPILARELRVAGRKRATYINRAGFALLLAIGTFFVLAVSIQDLGWGSQSVIYRAQRLGDVVQQLSLGLLWLGFAMLAFIGPILAAGAICDERRARTLDTLAATPITPLQIVTGKIAARMHEAAVLACIAAPALLALRVFGGVSTETIIGFCAVALATAYLGASLAAWFSSWHRNAAGATVYAALTLTLLTVSPLIFAVFGPRNNYFGLGSLGLSSRALSDVFTALPIACPPAVLALLTANEAAPQASQLAARLPASLRWLVDHPWVVTTLWLSIQATAVVLIAAWSVRKQLAKSGDPSARKRSEKERDATRLRKLKDFPVYWREATAPIFPRVWHAIVVGGVLAAFVGWAYKRVGIQDESLHFLFGFAGLALVALLAAISTTGTIAAEREARTWEVLLTVPISAREIIASKILAALRRLTVPLVLLLAHFTVAAVLGHVAPQDIPIMAIIVVPVLIFYLSTGLLFSLLFKRLINAITCNILLLSIIWIGIPIGAAILAGIASSGRGSFFDAVETAVFVTSPFAMLGATLEHATSAAPGAALPYRIAGNDEIGGLAFIGITAGLAVGHLAAAGLVFLLCLRVFRARSGRAS